MISMKKEHSSIKRALYFAAQKHDGQYRKGGRVPYIVHPVLVALSLSEYTDDERIITAALLHDVLEDCSDVSLAHLQEEFGQHIAQLVDEVSLVEEEEYATWKEKKMAYLEKIKTASPDALIIVAIDKMSNLQAYFSALREKNENVISHFRGTPDDYRWYYAEIGNILKSALGEHQIVKDYFEISELCKKENPQ